MGLVDRLRARLVTVPKPGTKPRALYPGEWMTCHTGGSPKAGDSAGECQVHSFTFFGNGAFTNHEPMKVQEHIYAVEPLCEEAAREIETLRAALDEAIQYVELDSEPPDNVRDWKAALAGQQSSASELSGKSGQ